MAGHAFVGTRKGKVLPFRGRDQEKPLTDLELMMGVRCGDNAALRDLFYRHGERVYRLFRSDYALDRTFAVQVVQDTFIGIWRTARAFDERCAVAGWIVRSALRLGINASLLRGIPPRVTSNPGNVFAIRRASEQTPEVVTELEAQVGALRWGPRIATVLLERERMSEAEIADALALSPRAVWTLVSTARAELGQRPRRSFGSGVLRGIGRAVRTGRLCPPLWKLNRAVANDLDNVGWHLGGCMECSREYAILVGVSTRLTDLPRHEMPPDARDRIAVALLAAPFRSLE
jgi:RNA polymerase sigma-70 factor (ECF subfamily)